MKSKQACFDPAIARMELRRFAPVWVLYLMLLVVTTFFNMRVGGDERANAALALMVDYIMIMVAYNFVYAFLLAQLLFGDLYTPRLCYAIHALPVSRGSYYGTQIILGLMGSILPNVLNAGLLLIFMKAFPTTALWWLAASEGQFLFFFGVAALSAVCAGNRFGQMLLDGIINFFGILLWWFQVNLYIPLLYGMTRTSSSGLMNLSPVTKLFDPALEILYTKICDERGYVYQEISGFHASSDYFLWLGIFAALGIGAIWLGLRLYKKRPLECAGDLVAFPQLKPVFLLLFTLTCGGFAHLVGFVFEAFSLPLLFLGLILGYFAGQMLLLRQVDVFRQVKKAPIVIICSLVLVSVMLTNLDVLGIARRVPDPEDVGTVELSDWDTFSSTDPETIKAITQVQALAIQQRQERFEAQSLFHRLLNDESKIAVGDDPYVNGTYAITYILHDGSTVRRQYTYTRESQEVPLLRQVCSQPEMVFADAKYNQENFQLDLEKLRKSTFRCQVVCDHAPKGAPEGAYAEDFSWFEDSSRYLDDAQMVRELFDAVLADCADGTMAQSWSLHPQESDHALVFYFQRDSRSLYTVTVRVFPDSRNTQVWLDENGIHE